MATFLGDLRDQLVAQTSNIASIAPQATVAAASYTLVGDTVDLVKADGPFGVLYSVGVTGGTPDSFSVTFKLQYALDSAFASPVDYVSVGADTPNPLTAVIVAKTDVIGLYFHPPVGARYWRVVATAAFVNGTTPTIGVSAYIMRQKKILGGSGTQLAVAVS